MIRYRCPRCQKPLTAQDNEAGAKKNCPHCEQRVQIPVPPPPNKTMLGAGTAEQDRPRDAGGCGPARRRAAAAYAAPAVPHTIVVETEATEAAPPAARALTNWRK